ncbi:helix-turn-helix domain-containing protein [Yokenella regensburgei]|uniref:helix-turn-helix domain-containing protein n=1 Tax=Yokenella regensburgei TaxID=158877 RepID=UPI001ED8EC18|nr:helix-turn-helix domain-containing protein [Yokenella regensburgei]KAF1368749.1 hypothetical protein FHR25_002499 [Yokenella regensburgei]
MKNSIDEKERIELCITQLEVLHKISVEQPQDNRSVIDLVILERFQELKTLTNPCCLDALPSTKVRQDVDMSAIGARIQLTRENLGLSDAELARNLKTYSNIISDWECGITEPPASMVIPLANALKCDLLWLLAGEPVATADEA